MFSVVERVSHKYEKIPFITSFNGTCMQTYSSQRNRISVGLMILSFGFLLPGVTMPMLTIDLHGKITSSMVNFDMDVLHKSASILQTVRDLWHHNMHLVAFLIFVFSMLVPALKGGLLVACHYMSNVQSQQTIVRWMRRIGKWAMADVFVVGIFLAFLSTQGAPTESIQRLQIMGFPLEFKVQISLHSTIETGFYFFLLNCLLSLVAFLLYTTPGPTKSIDEMR